ncbi:protein disulfide-isomerase A3 [Toxorhynchites rutilus septentrionalis]|uniref:protein disulfide-isomerase A3 n=1 Tax=Toxorhynchites rutilus septentrionalis TaxID=329112 RepID=UPI0024794AF1|nr:protein disulfide-isomerase A3 [Toxorhynchites rutilus septentrionalis]
MFRCKIVTYVVALLLTIHTAFAAEADVLDLTDSDFSTRVGETETTLVMFYAPWCGHCKKLKPEYAKAAELLRGEDPAIALAKIDCTEDGKETCNKFSVSGYPTLKVFKNGEVSQEYNGPRDATGIAKYMKSIVGPASKDLLTLDAFEAFLKVQETSVVGYFEKESDLKGVFLKYADSQRERLRFGHSSAKDVLEKQGENNAIYLIRAKQLANKFEPDFVKFEGKTKDELSTFVKENFHGLCGVRSRETINDFKNPLVVVYYAVDYVKNPKGTNYWRNRVLKVAKEFVGRVNFAVSAKDDFQHELNEYGYDYVGDKPLVLARDAKNQKFIMKEEFSVDNLQAFATDLEEGALEPYVKSEPIPESNDAPVKIAVGKNFEDVVTNNGVDTLIEFYAPWCGHCKKLTPVYEELATKLKDEEVAIVKMDATANDVPPTYDVRGFPTLFWLPKNGKNSPKRYEGGREVDDFIKYIAQHATDELKGWDRKGNEKKKDEL